MHNLCRIFFSLNISVMDNSAGLFRKRANQVVIVLLATLGIFLVTYKWQYSYTQFNDEQERLRLPGNTTSFKLEIDNGLTKFKEQLTEDDVTDVPCNDINKTTSAKNSKLYISKKEFSLGDEIRISLRVFDWYGKAKTNGGDQFRAVMKTPAELAYTNGVVIDYDNGTYDIIFEALWTGTAKIEVFLAYTKEAFAALYRLRLTNFPLVQIGGKYSHKRVTEKVLCDPDPNVLASYHICDKDTIVACATKSVTNKQDNCNFTSWNDGFPLFCARPKLKSLACSHLKFIGSRWNFATPKMTICEQTASRRCHQRLTKTISVAILPGKKRKNATLIPLSSCANYNRTALWSTNIPSGFFFQGRWHLRHCNGVDIKNKQSCLKDRRIYLIGDSTIRQWYLDISERYNCIQYTEQWTKRRWYKLSACRNSELNFTATYAIHGLPFNIRDWDYITSYLTSIAQRMDKIPDNENAIFVFHVYQHMIYFHPRYFKMKMEAVRSSAEQLLNRNKYVKIMVKGPHVFKNNRDVFENVFTRILYEVFRNLHDRVIFLNNRDATIAVQENNIHPIDMVVEAMVDQMIVFACN